MPKSECCQNQSRMLKKIDCLLILLIIGISADFFGCTIDSDNLYSYCYSSNESTNKQTHRRVGYTWYIMIYDNFKIKVHYKIVELICWEKYFRPIMFKKWIKPYRRYSFAVMKWEFMIFKEKIFLNFLYEQFFNA